MDYFVQFLDNFPEIKIVYQVAQGIAILLDACLLAAFIFALRQLRKYRPKFVYNPTKWERYLKKKKKVEELASPVVSSAWNKIQAKVQEGTPDSLRLAVIEADGVVDEVLKRMGLAGETFADRLAHVKPEHYLTVEKVWDAHRVRNNLVHTPDFQLPSVRATEAVAAYEAFLKEAKALK